jgi:hypothetical protein
MNEKKYMSIADELIIPDEVRIPILKLSCFLFENKILGIPKYSFAKRYVRSFRY